MAEVDVHEARMLLSQLLERVTAGEEIIIARAGKPIAELVPIMPTGTPVFGVDRGRFEVPDDFNAPLPDHIAALFER